uniref:Enoyl reductase (ER) domain-containing protein n=2 Tax=Neobodo designis TaxID=312471 RepID=A0A7S1QSV7_NEODS
MSSTTPLATAKHENLPETMRAFRLNAYGTNPAEVITEERIPLPSVTEPSLLVKGKPTQILVRVAASALNPLDTKLGSGMAKAVQKCIFPLTPGSDFAGTVVSVPAGVDTDLRVGDRVCGSLDTIPRVAKHGHGTFSEFVAPQAAHVVRLPDSLSFAEGAGIGVVACTVWQSFVGQLGITPPPEGHKVSPAAAGKKILILGGSSTCGIFTTQLARAWGFSDVTVTSTQEALCKSYGATRVVNYRETAPEKQWWNVLKGENFDVLYNAAEGRLGWDKCGNGVLKGCYAGGRYNTLVIDYPEKTFTWGMVGWTVGSVLWRKGISWLGYPAYNLSLDTKIGGPGIAECTALASNGTLRIPVDARGPFPATLDAMHRMWTIQHTNAARGKLVMAWD